MAALLRCSAGFGIINGVWHEFHADPADEHTVLD